MPATAQTTNGGTEAGRPQPQTTVQTGQGPFIRFSQPGMAAQYNNTGNAFAGMVTQPLVSVPGYVRGYRATVNASGGTSTAACVATPDAPFNVVSLVTVTDSFGTPLIVGPGYEILKLLPQYSGQFGLDAARDVTKLPSYSAIQTATGAGCGDFSFSSMLPLEVAKGYGVISGANAALLPKISWNLAGASSVYSTAPTTLPTVGVQVDASFYWLSEGVAIEPPGLGTTCQWVVQQCNPVIGSGASQSVSLPRLGGYISELIFVLRDSTGARIDAWPSRFRLLVDGVPLINETLDELEDDQFISYQGVSRPVGVQAISRKTSINQQDNGLFDTGEALLSTAPGTLIEVEGMPWGAITNAPATLSVLVGQVVPSGALVTGLPEA